LGFEECMVWLVGLPKKTNGNWRQVNLWEGRFDHSSGRRGYGVGCWKYLKILVQLDARNFKRAEGILRFEEVMVKTCGATWCSWMQGKEKRIGG